MPDADDRFFGALNALFAGDVDPMVASGHMLTARIRGPRWHLSRRVGRDPGGLGAPAAFELGGEIHGTRTQLQVGEDLAVSHAVGSGSDVTSDGTSVDIDIRGTNVFRRERHEWKMIAHQSDPLPYLPR